MISSWLHGSTHGRRQSRMEGTSAAHAAAEVPSASASGVEAVRSREPTTHAGPQPDEAGGVPAFHLDTPPPLRALKRRASLVVRDDEEHSEEIEQELMIGEIKVMVLEDWPRVDMGCWNSAFLLGVCRVPRASQLSNRDRDRLTANKRRLCSGV